ncbi:MAG: hypothetical protein HC880_02200 [Bacteroidia bacterium]|nr:hypothetical protein [Bacteroidia bacterium]
MSRGGEAEASSSLNFLKHHSNQTPDNPGGRFFLRQNDTYFVLLCGGEADLCFDPLFRM